MKKNRISKAFFIGTALLFLVGSMAYAVLPTIFIELELPDWFFGVSLGVMLGGELLFSPFWGQLMTVLGTRRVFLIGGFGCALGQGMLGFSTSVWGMLAGRFLAGFFAGGCFSCSAAHIVSVCDDPKERGTFLAVNAAITGICPAFSYLLGGLLGEISPRLTMLVQVIALCAVGVFLYFATPDDSVGQKPDGRTLLKEANPFTAFKVGKNFLSKAFIILFSVVALHNLGTTVFDQTFNYYICDVFGLSSGYNGVIRSVMGLCALAANSLVALRILKKGREKAALAPLLVIASVTMASAILFPSIAPFIAANVLFYVSANTVLPLLQQVTSDMGKNVSGGQLMGFFTGVRTAGGIVAAFSAGVLYDIDPRYPFIFGFLAFLLATALSVFFTRNKKGA